MGFSLEVAPSQPHNRALPLFHHSPSLVELLVPMHRACGRFARAPADVRERRICGVSAPKGHTSPGAPATPEVGPCSAVHHLPRLSAASASAAAANVDVAISAARDMDDVCELQPLLSPPACLVLKSLRLGTGDSVFVAN